MKYLSIIAIVLCMTACTTTQNVSDPTHGKGGLIKDDPNGP
ncbi:hypothetical protein P256_00079 [Acinetobacter nectaris CIP 110549]|uniref:Lipoprotein n=1 Tax=Acinetobacter nectaris CIP 110549 TaxID=1392540 RepID=V2V0L6_9GAMM|nr:hypothetical protein [Acinetobacter nectaris]ESK41094.1 hypothetical protein P256_00079 [Acinetobacter nectaris CIP 110549]